MPIEHVFEAAPGYLAVRIAGPYSLRELQGTIVAIGAEAERGGHARALIDTTGMQGDMPDMDRFENGALAAERLASLDRVAILMGEKQRVNHFFEDVARNRGLEVRVLQDRGEALAWITSP